ncbi:hypothetical protein AVEN_188190-1 [Araneus ventricosus]|uniref:Uncharacterized protein n=1 Tax=Araneus ventricosus TaxID=182803 RepID=A0A4Y2UBS0_ARAVE|nr:hypothetical protein AVEN_188190-1 [Araneus ventricosus]
MDSSEESSGTQDISDQPGPSSTYYPDVSDRGGLMVRCRPRSRRVLGSKTDSNEDPSCIKLVARRGLNVLPLVWCGNFEGGDILGVVLVI